jgi:rhodanese-related sulfurtransferase
MTAIDPTELRRRWRDGCEVALFDVRDEIDFAAGHPFFAVSLPLPEIESRIFDLVPRLRAPIVVYDDGEGLAARAVARITALGYQDVDVLAGGLARYRSVGEVFQDVNVPSKAFGELVESICHTPSLSAGAVNELLANAPDAVVLDARRFEEFRTMSIPRGQSVPGGELALRIFDAAPSAATPVIVNCAGRTRSIIGAQTLLNIGVPHRVAALRNGTIGWTIAGLPLERGQTRAFRDLSAEGRARAQTAAARWAERVGVPALDRAAFERWRAERDERTLYLCDVRSPEEFFAARPRGFASTPGGQFVQATDEWIAVRGARIVLFDDDGVRARMAASWLVQMGWEAAVLADGVVSADEIGEPPPRRAAASTPARVETWTVATLRERRREAAVVDLAPSGAYRAGHIPGAHFIRGTRLQADIARVPGAGPIVLTSPDGRLAADNAGELVGATARPVGVLDGGTAAWMAAGLPLETQVVSWLSEPRDVYKRPYEGTDNPRAAMQAYIDWELQLIAQIANDGVCNFRVVRPR